MSINPHVTVVHDNSIQDRSFIKLVKRYQNVRLVDVKSLCAEDLTQSLLIIVQVDLTDPESLRPLKETMSRPERAPVPVLFLLNQFNRREVIQANTLGATDYMVYPCPHQRFITVMGDLISRTVEKAWSALTPTQEAALKVSLKVVEDTFSHAETGAEISQEDVKNSCDLIIEATAKDGLSDWMHAIRQHHNYTYRHSMMVCGYLVSFGMLLGVNKSELQQLSIGGMLHDIGKAYTPLKILDKPSGLTPSEWKIMKKHPGNARFLLDEDEWDEVLLDIAIHHHEKLDGSGYPDGLKGAEVSDMARMAAIADVFSGLTDKRSYKPSMPAEKAISIMLDMEGHLDIPLVKAFRAVVLPEEANTFALQQ